MRKTNLTIVILFLMMLMVVPNLKAQTTDEQNIKSVISSLLDLSKTRSYEKAAKILAYTGDDKTRNLSVPFNSADKNELSQVKRFVNRVSSLLQLSSKYELGDIITDEENNTYDIEIFFTSGEQRLKTILKLVKVKSGFLVYDLD